MADDERRQIEAPKREPILLPKWWLAPLYVAIMLALWAIFAMAWGNIIPYLPWM